MQIIVDNILVNYQVSGSGSKIILLLHGWGSNSTAFSALSSELSKKYKIVALDLPGMGQSQLPPTAWNLDDYKNFVTSFLAKLNINKVYSIIGHSNGGSLAIKMAADKNLAANFKLSKLVLIGSAGIRYKQKLKKQIFKLIAKLGKGGLSILPLPASAKLKLKKKLYQAAGSEALDNPELEQTFRLVVGEDISPQAAKLKLPTLLIYGKQDADTPVEYGQILSSLIENSKLEVVEGGGHYIFLDQPKITLNLIEDFLK